jgi:hypothetical protein
MKVVFAGITVCTGKGTNSPEAFSYEGEATEQVAKFLRGTTSAIYNRGNEYSAISFDLFIGSLPSIQAAEKFVLNFRQPTVYPAYGTLALTADDGSGTNTSVMYMPGAFFKKGKVKYKGCMVWVSFNFTGGAFTSVKPST